MVPRLEKMTKTPERAAKISRSVGILVSLLTAFLLITALCNVLLPELYTSIRDMVFKVPGQLNSLLDQINEMNSKDTTINMLVTNAIEEGSNYLQNWLRNDLLKQTNVIMTNLTVGVINVLSEVLNFCVGIIVSILNQVLVRSGREEQATMTSLAALVVVLMIVVQRIAELFDMVKTLFEF